MSGQPRHPRPLGGNGGGPHGPAAGRGTGAFARRCHRACFACRSREEGGLGLEFRASPDGSVSSRFSCPSRYQGYAGRLHGGIVAVLLDAAMTHALFAFGIEAVTARLEIRYSRPVATEVEALLEARLLRRRRRLFVLEAAIVQDGATRAMAEGRFLIPVPAKVSG